MLTRRRFLLGTAAAAGWTAACTPVGQDLRPPVWVNDLHAQLSRTAVLKELPVASVKDVQGVIQAARKGAVGVSIAGGRHAMGGQPFGGGTLCLDTRPLNRVLRFDPERGLLEVEAGIQWPAVIDHLLAAQRDRPRAWGIVQKQTGADRLTLGGALAANIHGRGLRFPPIVADVESFVLVDAGGEARRCSRTEHPELFRLAIGGYGLFGVMTSVTLRLAPRRKLQRVVEVIDVDTLPAAFARRVAEGYEYGDFQYATDPASDDYLRTGVFSCYRPVDDATPMPAVTRELALADWNRLLYLSHADKRRAFQEYAGYYRSTSGQLYWSDTHQLSVYVDHYHATLDRQLGSPARGTEMISEIYVPRPALPRFLADVREDFRRGPVEVIYGTVRLIERDTETVLAWAREPWACVIFNLHVTHTPAGIAAATDAFRRLIDHGLRHGGSYYLTYHRWATRPQVERAHPRFVEFLREKQRWDPEGRFQSDWYRHYRQMFADALR
jgi:FAD/FMN-containing dehydrogenase